MTNRAAAITRRQALTSVGAGAGVLAGAATFAAEAEAAATPWDHEADVVCVGSGGAALSAAVAAVDAGASVLILEKLQAIGGTTGKSGGGFWIPNNSIMRAQGKDDRRDDCLRYMARYAYPQIYTPNSPTLGLPEDRYRMLATFYDNASPMIDRFVALGALKVREFRMYDLDTAVPDHADHLPENKQPTGRGLQSAIGSGELHHAGAGLVHQLEAWLHAKNVPILLEHRVTALATKDGRVIGVEARTGDKTMRIHARKGVVFGTGGFAHNVALVQKHVLALWGACALPGSTGDFIPIATAAGASMGNMGTVWGSQVLFEDALENRAVGLGVFFLPGDSMIAVNKYGKRVVNEKRSYNDRTRVHYWYDPSREEYPNELLFMVFDQRTMDAFGGNFPLPLDKRDARFLIEGKDWAELAANLDARLAALADHSGGVRLDPNFVAELKQTVARFNGYAKTGVDGEFERGKHNYDRVWNLLFSRYRKGSTYPENRLPNPVMYPLAKTGPYYAFILAAGALDTSGGPEINEQAQVLDGAGKAIPGLYGAGNCVASITNEAYFGSGGTLGPAMTFGYIAGRNAAGNDVTKG